jgi:hypothetical protein
MRELIAVTDRMAPNLECYVHGNLPVQTSPFADESESSSTLFAEDHPRRKKEANVGLELRTYKSTRVDVDSNGRRSLVNDIR